MHLLKSDKLLDALNKGLGTIEAAEADHSQTQLRACCCAVLAQLSTLDATAAMLVDHDVLETLATLRPHVGVEVARDIDATLFEVDLVSGTTEPKHADEHAAHKHVMLSYQWCVVKENKLV
jgi:hypothetical protein